MANYHLEIRIVGRKKGPCVTKLADYITGRELSDNRNGKLYHKRRHDVLYCRIFQPSYAPPEFYGLQYLCAKIEEAEIRRDARTAREFIGSLPNELPTQQLIHIVCDFVEHNFVNKRLCAIAAIHEGRNELDPSKNNPHVHIIVSTRTVEANGFSKKKDREHDHRKYINIWREQWADVQNQAYERCQLDIRVSHESLEVQGKAREPTIHLSRIDWMKEQCGEHTDAGNRKRAIKERNAKRTQHRQIEPECEMNVDLY